MHSFDTLRTLRRRWYFPLLGVAVAAAAGWFTAPGVSERPVRFQSVATLLVEERSAIGSGLSLEQAALLATTGAVPARVGEILEVPAKVGARADTKVRSLTITTTSATRAGAEAAADEYSLALVDELGGSERATYDADLEAATQALADLEQQLAAATSQLAGVAPDDPNRAAAEAQLSAVSSRYSSALDALSNLQAAGAPLPPLKVIDRTDAKRIDQRGVRAPDSKPARAGLLGSFGLLIGAGGAITAERLDRRIRGTADVEQAFRLPVLAEIPPLPPGRRNRHELFAVTQPSLPFVEAYRSLRTVILHAAATAHLVDGVENGADPARLQGAAQHADHDSQVVLVTSPTAGEGKTTTVAHLAALLAEVGKEVLVVSADFRRPRIHDLFGVPREPGLSDVLMGSSEIALADLDLDTGVPGVRLLRSGSPVTNPAPFLRETAELVAAARQLVDYVLVDTAPVLVANDATELAGVADMVIVLCREGHTDREAARRTAETLERVEARVLGSVVIAARDTPSAYGYYRYRYYSDVPAPSGERSRRRRRRDREAPPPADDAEAGPEPSLEAVVSSAERAVAAGPPAATEPG